MNARPFFRPAARALLPLLIGAAALSSSKICKAQLPNADAPKTATVRFDVGKFVTPHRQKAVFELVGVQPSQVVAVALAYPITLAGQRVTAEPLDGGRAIVAEGGLAVAADGMLSLQFQAGATPGLYQVRLHRGASAIALQFWVFDNEHLVNNPPVLTPN